VAEIIRLVTRMVVGLVTAIARVAQQVWNAWRGVDPVGAGVTAGMLVIALFISSRFCEISAVGAAVCISIAALRRQQWSLVEDARSGIARIRTQSNRSTTMSPGRPNGAPASVVEVANNSPERAQPRVTGNSAVERLRELLEARIIGQQMAVEAVVSGFESVAAGTRPKSHSPLSYLMIGPTGTGKTEVAKLTAEALRRPFYRVDMGQHKDREGLWQLLGSPQGYIGGEGMLTRHVADNRTSVLLFDEIEKGSSEMYDFMLPMLDEGVVKDRRTDRGINFSQTVIFFTSNLIAEVPRDDATNQNRLRDLVLRERFFRQEFVGRIGTLVPFFAFAVQDMEKITKQQLRDYLNQVCRDKGMSPQIIIDRSTIEFLVSVQDEKYGARNCASSIEQYVEPRLRKALLANGSGRPAQMTVQAGNGEVSVRLG
jgi:ATP-dependent Clp protease ATP-binding subunit ClpA